LLYSSASNTLAKLAIGTANYILTVNSGGTNVQWSAPSSISVSTATNLAGGVAGSVPYQSGASTTTFLAIGAADRVMTSSGTAPQWVTALTGLTGVSSSSITNTSLTSGRVVYSGTGGLQTNSANLTFDGTTLTTTGVSNTGTSTIVKLLTVGNTSFNGTTVFAAATPAKLYMGTGTATDTTSAIGATNAVGAVASLAITPIAATNTSVTYTDAATLYIAGAPSAGTNITLTNPYALYIAAGNVYLGGGTANGVAYLNGSKVLTTGSALVFDGTNLGLGVTPSAWNSGYSVLQIKDNAVVSGNAALTSIANAYIDNVGAYRYTYAYAYASLYEQSNGVHAWKITTSTQGLGNPITFTQAMTLTAGSTLLVGYTSGNEVTKIETPSISIGQTGTTSTTAKIRFAPAQAGYNVMGIYNSQSASGGGLVFVTGDSTTNSSNAALMTLETSGNLLVGTTSQIQAGEYCFQRRSGANESTVVAKQADASGGYNFYSIAQNNGGTYYHIVFENGATNAGSITSNGTTTVLNPTSDIRLKENIVDAGSALEKINAVRIRSFNWKLNNQFTDFGVIAQELNEIAPECVKVGSDEINEDGELKDPWCAQPYVLVPAMIKAIQEQQALITQLTARITALEGA
jgi:hypothetical protein